MEGRRAGFAEASDGQRRIRKNSQAQRNHQHRGAARSPPTPPGQRRSVKAGRRCQGSPAVTAATTPTERIASVENERECQASASTRHVRTRGMGLDAQAPGYGLVEVLESPRAPDQLEELLAVSAFVGPLAGFPDPKHRIKRRRALVG